MSAKPRSLASMRASGAASARNRPISTRRRALCDSSGRRAANARAIRSFRSTSPGQAWARGAPRRTVPAGGRADARWHQRAIRGGRHPPPARPRRGALRPRPGAVADRGPRGRAERRDDRARRAPPPPRPGARHPRAFRGIKGAVKRSLRRRRAQGTQRQFGCCQLGHGQQGGNRGPRRPENGRHAHCTPPPPPPALLLPPGVRCPPGAVRRLASGPGPTDAKAEAASSRRPSRSSRRTAIRRACSALARSPRASSVVDAAASARGEPRRSRIARATSASATTQRARASSS